MKRWFFFITSNWHVAAFLVGFNAWAWFMVGRWSRHSIVVAMAAILAVIAGGLVFRLKWARLAGFAVLLLLLAHKIYGLFTLDFTFARLCMAVAYASSAYCLWKEPDRSVFQSSEAEDDKESNAVAEEEDSKPIISLVHLRSQQRYLEAPVLANALSEAWGLNIVGGEGEDAEGTDGFVAGENPLYLVMVQKPVFAMFMVHNHDKNYFDEPEEVAGKVPNLRFSQIIRDHAAWLAVDLMQVKDNSLDSNEAYRLIGKAISALADDDVMAIMCPQHHFLNLWSPELETLLCGDSPLDALREEVKAPVFGVPDGDLIENAIAEARRRWPEFVAVFKNRQPEDDRFIVKAPFTGEDGQVEHMWLQVFGLEPEYVHGHLANHPLHTTKLKQGSQVEVPVAEISDWICPDAEGNPLGNFTHQAVSQAVQQKSEA